ncbi:NAD(P)H nitroreductase [Williamsia muralis]|uniref:Acg family FMN-binding oxidoreductase n=1 Tax=Williamsia marianensis TaxID=85044 RepID=UPI003F13CF67
MTQQPDADTLRTIIELACRAPSVHNSQPWLWTLNGTELRLNADARHAVLVADPHGRQMVLSLGAVLHHLEAASAASGFRTSISRLPNPNRPDHVATIEFGGRRPPLPAFGERGAAIKRRFTDRLPMRAPAEPTLQSVLDGVTPTIDARLSLLPETSRQEVARTSKAIAAERRYDYAYHTELDWWTSDRDGRDSNEGVPTPTLLTASEAERVPVARDFSPAATGQPRRADISADEAAIVVLSSPTGGRHDLLRCGEALSVLLLEATVAGLSTCIVSHMTESPAGTATISRLIDGVGQPQVLVRIGIREGPTPKLTPRRPVEDVFDIV